MKLQNIIYTAAVVAAVSLFAGCATEKEEKEAKESQAQLMAEAKVSRADAERTALAKVPNGTIKEGELEREKGKLIWSFDIATPGTKDITEVNVDAVSGEVVAMDKESAKDEAKEAKKDKDDDEKEEKK